MHRRRSPVKPTRPAAHARGALLLLVLAALPLAAHSPVDPASIGRGHPTGHMTDRADAGWPPQPRGISAVVSKSDPAGEARAREELQRATRAAERAALARADVRAALGRRYERIGLRRASGKHGTTGPAQLVFFSHDRRATVEVAVDDPAGATVRVTPATEYQPEITDEEIAAAGKLARAHFLALGRERVAALQAFGILAYEPRGRGFYPTRVLYISFHEDAEAPPEFAAWVDLTRERVLRIREESR